MNKQQKENTQVLISVLEDKIARDESEDVLDSWFQPCGTYGCVAGDYLIKRYGPVDKETLNNKNLNLRDKYVTKSGDTLWSILLGFEEEFGFTEDFDKPTGLEIGSIFGTKKGGGSLIERLNYVKSQIN